MPHPLVRQLRFTRSEFRRALAGLSEEDAMRRLLPMNCISWNIGHLAWQEQRYWLTFAQGITPLPDLNTQFANGAPACTPSLDAIWQSWHTIIEAADPWLDTVTTGQLQLPLPGTARRPNVILGSLLYRMIYHYWYHTGESLGIRQMLGHANLPDFVGNIDDEAPYRPE